MRFYIVYASLLSSFQEAVDRQKFSTVRTEQNLHIPLASGNVMKIPLSSIADETAGDGGGGGGGGGAAAAAGGGAGSTSAAAHRPPPLNLSEELNKSGLWKHIESETSFVQNPPSYHHHYQK